MLYGAGIAGTFIFIGLLVSFLSWGVNDAAVQSGYANIGNFIATNAWLNLALGLVFIFFALVDVWVNKCECYGCPTYEN